MRLKIEVVGREAFPEGMLRERSLRSLRMTGKKVSVGQAFLLDKELLVFLFSQ